MMAASKPAAGINVKGLKELQKALKDFTPEHKKELSVAGKALATDIANEAKGAAGALGGVAAKVAPSIKPTTLSYGLLRSGVLLGDTASPRAAGAEFGGRGRPTTQQFQPHRGTAGYFLYPTIRREAPQIEERMTDAIDNVLQKVGLL